MSPAPAQKDTAKARSAARLAAVQALYQMDLAGTDVNDVIAEFRDHPMVEIASGPGNHESDTDFFAAIVKGVVAGQQEIDPMLDAQLAEGWRLPRIDSILRAILRSAAFELLHRKDIPVRVVITEYLNVAHAFFDGDEPGVVNGILDALSHRLRKTEFEDAPDA